MRFLNHSLTHDQRWRQPIWNRCLAVVKLKSIFRLVRYTPLPKYAVQAAPPFVNEDAEKRGLQRFNGFGRSLNSRLGCSLC